MTATRRLAAILAADVAGYSRLMGADEEGTHERLKALRRELLDPKIAEHHGRIVKTTGDGALVEFASVVDAVRCAVAVQQAMPGRDTDIGPDNRIELRIGINLGDVIVEGDDLYGDCVNIAARIEALADAGGVFVSNTVHDQVRDRLPYVFEDLGEQQVKNIARPVRVYRVGLWSADPTPTPPSPASGGGLGRGRAREGSALIPGSSAGTRVGAAEPLALPGKPSIAVLPFQNMSGDPEQEYFADGMVEEIITALSRIRWLFVIARNSSFSYKGQAIDVKQVGRELGVRYVLEGSVRKAGGRVRITVQLIETETGANVWAERYDRSLDDIFALQDEITLSIVGAIEPSLRAVEIERVKRKRPESLDAYDLVLRALPQVFAAMPEESRIAVPLLERALALEPDYGLAHGYLALCHEIVFRGGGFEPEIGAASVRHAHAAIALGRDDATALALGAFVVALVEHDRPAAIEAFETALALSPSCSIAFIFGSVAMGWAGEAERALKWGEQAIRLSPFDRLIYSAYQARALGHFANRRYEEAANAARRAAQGNPGFSIMHMLLAASLAAHGRDAEANAVAARVLTLQPNFTIDGHCAGLAVPAALAVPLAAACHRAGLP